MFRCRYTKQNGTKSIHILFTNRESRFFFFKSTESGVIVIARDANSTLLQVGHPCVSTVAHGLQVGHPCVSTVAHGLQGGHPCVSTVSHGLQGGHPCASTVTHGLQVGHPCVSTVAHGARGSSLVGFL